MDDRAEDYLRVTGLAFPSFRVLAPEDVEQTKKAFASRLGLDIEASALDVNRACLKRSFVIGSIDDKQQSFDLRGTLAAFTITAGNSVLVDWNQFDPVFEMLLDDASTVFSYLWHSVSDDLAIFDDSGKWMLIFLHYGEVRLATL